MKKQPAHSDIEPGRGYLFLFPVAIREDGEPMPMWFVANVLEVYHKGGDEYFKIINPLTCVVSEIKRGPWLLIYNSIEEASDFCSEDLSLSRELW